MRSLEELLRENNLKDPDDIDALLELAEITGNLISGEQYSNMEILINYTISNEYYDIGTMTAGHQRNEVIDHGNQRIAKLVYPQDDGIRSGTVVFTSFKSGSHALS